MWKAVRFERTEQQDALQQMLDFVNAHHLQPGQFQFAVAADEQGHPHCIMLYSEEKAAAAPPIERPAPQQARGPGRFAPPGGPPTERPGRPAGRGFKPRFGPPGGGRGRPGGGGRAGRPGPPRGGGPSGGGRPPRRPGGPKRGR